ncbi:acyl-CoA dehydrogenase family protein [Hydrogenophaga sp. BPS33]|uniref:acyl-CoA dehydrogenase family protein n=1 Tax=Hydrogenophaga sp. BPS33 TaxID=2651974 RepID=UPI00131F74D3|nr:acyl-CoA dehydrogenase family protein [Hydrogenophaga sp. BPS33]QHE84589.1 hypothetical protein F9K07_06665 [Hydrogenophaga sp. BPS33]
MEMSKEIHETASRLFGDVVTPHTQERSEAGVLDAATWEGMNGMGLGLVMVPEAHGGIGGGLPEAAAILRAAGEHAVPGPVLEWVLGNALLSQVGEAPSEAPLALAFTAPAQAMLRDVPWLRQTPRCVVVGDAGLAWCDVRGLVIEDEGPDASGEPLARATLPADLEWHAPGGWSRDACLRRAALLRGAQMLGAMQWCLARTVAYTQERKQFGREIGKFQVVQQTMAEMASAVVAAQIMLDAAIADPDNVAMVAAARSRLGDAADTVFAHAHQVHGAIGFSYEYVLHFRTRRLMAWRDQFGTVAQWRRHLSGCFEGVAADGVWPVIAGV